MVKYFSSVKSCGFNPYKPLPDYATESNALVSLNFVREKPGCRTVDFIARWRHGATLCYRVDEYSVNRRLITKRGSSAHVPKIMQIGLYIVKFWSQTQCHRF